MNERVLDGEMIAGRLDDHRTYDGVRTRRVMAFLLDYAIVLLMLIPFGLAVFLFGIVTFGLGWGLFAVLGPLVALTYVWNTLGGSRQATLGMRMMSIRLERLDGQPIDGLTAVVHTVLFWAGNVIVSPLILLATLFLDRKRTVHDLLLGTVVARSDR